MFEEYLKLARILQDAGKVNGRVKIQKLVYILKFLGYDFDEDFSFQRYGPFSQELSVELAEMRDSGIVLEKSDREGPYETFGYSLTPKGSQMLGSLPPPKLPSKLIVELNKKSRRELELLASIMYLQKSYATGRLVKRLKALKPDFDITEIESAAKQVENFKRECSASSSS